PGHENPAPVGADGDPGLVVTTPGAVVAGQPQPRAGGRGVADRCVVVEVILAGRGRYEDPPPIWAGRDRAGTGTRTVAGARGREAREPQARAGCRAVGDRGRRPDRAAVAPADRAETGHEHPPATRADRDRLRGGL